MERLLRLSNGYASRDGRFYIDRVAGGRWRAIDAIRRKGVEFTAATLREVRGWIGRRRQVRP